MITLDFTPIEEERIASVARQSGLDTTDYVKKLVRENLPPEPTNAPPAVSEKNAAAIALLESWLAEAPTDPDEIRKADAEADELMENLNRNRIEAGERPLFP